MAENLYVDTRGLQEKPLHFSEVIVRGLAEGGGLFVPQGIPFFELDELMALRDLSYAKRAAEVYKLFGIDIDDTSIDELMDQSYGTNFDTEDICPLTTLDANTHVLELWHGPTSAFKDMALQCLPHFFTASARRLKQEGKLDNDFLILVATSGDTGKAALEGFKDKEGIRIGVLYPQSGVSDIQYKQMATQSGSNVMVWAVEGNFDDCQAAVKAVFSDKDFAKELFSRENLALSSANSINWGRLLPQFVYYVSSYVDLVAQGKLKAGSPIDICVPTGNFGNILAAWYAKMIGVPIENLFCASNENRVLTDFINTGTYDISDRDFALTPSPSMDILVSSNLERQLFELTNRDAKAIRGWMNDLRENGRFRVDPDTFAALRKHFSSDSIDNTTCLATIKEVFEKHNYLIDPHTAVAYKVAENLRGDNPIVIVSTAHWAKFGENVYRGLHNIAPNEALPDAIAKLSGCKLNELITHETDCRNIPDNLAHLDDSDIRFTGIIGKERSDVKNAVFQFLECQHSANERK